MTVLRTTCHVNQKANGEITKILAWYLSLISFKIGSLVINHVRCIIFNPGECEKPLQIVWESLR